MQIGEVSHSGLRMSNAPMFKRLLAGPALDRAKPEARPNLDAERMLAAVGRMESAVRGERDTLERLRAHLGEILNAIEGARAAADAAAASQTALLRSLEGCIKEMSELVGAVSLGGKPGSADAPPIAQPPPRPADEQAFFEAMRERSHVEPVPAPEADDPRVPTVSDVVSQLGRAGDASTADEAASGNAATGGEVTTVAMLETMVEALAASMPAAAPAEPEAMPEAAASSRRDPIMPEVELLSSLARVEAMPLLPAEMGTAVIFAPKPDFAATPPDQAQPAEPDPQTPPAAEAPAGQNLEATPSGEPANEPLAQAGEPDLEMLLFEPQPETDPAGFLLESTAWDHDPPQLQATSEPAAAPEPPPAEQEPEARPAPAAAPRQREDLRQDLRQDLRHDPLAPLKAMSDEEKIALFG